MTRISSDVHPHYRPIESLNVGKCPSTRGTPSDMEVIQKCYSFSLEMNVLYKHGYGRTKAALPEIPYKAS